jgi:hypothetical protein
VKIIYFLRVQSSAINIHSIFYWKLAENFLKMRLFVSILFAVISVVSAQHQQQQLDPAYLRQYYAQLAQKGGAQGAPRSAAPIFEPAQEQQQGPIQFSPQSRNVS